MVGYFVLVIIGGPVLAAVACVVALAPLRRRSRLPLSLGLVAACVAVALWWRPGLDGVFVVAPAIVILLMRVLLDGFACLAERVEPET